MGSQWLFKVKYDESGEIETVQVSCCGTRVLSNPRGRLRRNVCPSGPVQQHLSTAGNGSEARNECATDGCCDSFSQRLPQGGEFR